MRPTKVATSWGGCVFEASEDMANLLNAFPLSIYHGALDLEPEDRQRLVEAVLEMGRTPPPRGRGSAWTGDVSGHAFLHQDARFGQLFAAFTGHLRQYLDLLKIDRDKLHLYYTRSWATISQGRESIAPHSHLQSHISLVYYLQKPPQSGGIAFFNSTAPNQFAPNLFHNDMVKNGIVKEAALVNSQVINMDPEEGTVLIFPSMTRHGTAPNLTDQPRLSIAVDIVTTVRDGGSLEFLLPDLDKWSPAS